MAANDAGNASQAFTTIMIRNIPRTYSAPQVAHELRRFLAPADFDFVYVPWDKAATTSMGFGFANLRSPSVARAALARLADQPWMFKKYNRKMQAQPARVQGLSVNLQRFKRDVADRGGLMLEHAPLVQEDGVPMKLFDAFAKYCPDNDHDELAQGAHATPNPAWDVQASYPRREMFGRFSEQVGVSPPPGLEGMLRFQTPETFAKQIPQCGVVSPQVQQRIGKSSRPQTFQAQVLQGVDFFDTDYDDESDAGSQELPSSGASAINGCSDYSEWPTFDSLGSSVPTAADLSQYAAPHVSKLAQFKTSATCASFGPFSSPPASCSETRAPRSLGHGFPTVEGMPTRANMPHLQMSAFEFARALECRLLA